MSSDRGINTWWEIFDDKNSVLRHQTRCRECLGTCDIAASVTIFEPIVGVIGAMKLILLNTIAAVHFLINMPHWGLANISCITVQKIENRVMCRHQPSLPVWFIELLSGYISRDNPASELTPTACNNIYNRNASSSRNLQGARGSETTNLACTQVVWVCEAEIKEEALISIEL